jgi:ribonuclease HI
MKSLAFTLRSTPTAGLEIAFDLPPLDLFVQREAMLTCQRIQGRNKKIWDGIGSGNKRGHIYWASALLGMMGETDFDLAPKSFHWQRRYDLDFSSFNDGVPSWETGVVGYTDGSRHHDLTGWGFCLKGEDGQTLVEGRGHLGEEASVFQAEVFAIREAAENLLDSDTDTVTFYVDSQSALLALDKWFSESHLVRECKAMLDRLSENKAVTLKWVKAHIGHEGNERADTLAKEGAAGEGPVATLRPPYAMFRSAIMDHLRDRWELRWKALVSCRQSRAFMPTPDPSIRRGLLRLNRKWLSIMIQFITGHNFLNYHMSNQQPWQNSDCRLCAEETNETAMHLVMDCPCLMTARQEIFLLPQLAKIPKWTVPALLRFVRKDAVLGLLTARGVE